MAENLLPLWYKLTLTILFHAQKARSCLKTNKSNYTSAGVYVLRFGTDEGEAPVSPWDGLVADVIVLTVVFDVEGASLACGHLVAKGEDVGIATGIEIREDGLAILTAGIWMDEETAVGTQQDIEEAVIVVERGIIDKLGQTAERHVGGEHAHDAPICLTEGPAIGGDGLMMVDTTLGILNKRIDPARLARLQGTDIAHLRRIVVLWLIVGDHRIALILGIEGHLV